MISRRLTWARLVARMEEGRKTFKISSGVSKKRRVIKSRRLRWTGHVARMEEDRSAFKILTGKPTGNIPLGRPRRR